MKSYESRIAVENGGVIVCSDDDQEMGYKVIMLKTLNFWLYFLVYMFGVFDILVYLNNLGQIVESRGSSKASSLVSLASSFGFFGRILPRLLDYYSVYVKL